MDNQITERILKKLDDMEARMENGFKQIREEIKEVKDDLRGVKDEFGGIKGDLRGIKGDLRDVKDRVILIENDHGTQLKALFDGQQALQEEIGHVRTYAVDTQDKLTRALWRLEDKVESGAKHG